MSCLHRFLILCLMLVSCFEPASPRVRFRSKESKLRVRRGKMSVKKKIKTRLGSLSKGKNASLEGTTYELDDTMLEEDDGINQRISAMFNPAVQSLTLANQTIKAQDGNARQSYSISGDCSLEGFPDKFDGATAVSLANAATVLNMRVTSPLTTSVALGGGCIRCQRDLKISDGKTLVGPGAVELRSTSLEFGAQPLTFGNSLRLLHASDVIFHNKITLTSEWTFSGDAVISGNGNILDISQGGTIRIESGTTLKLANLKIKGLGLGKILFDADDSQLCLTNVEIEMNRDYTFTIGGVIAEGPTVIVTKNRTLTFDMQGSLTVDGINLFYDTTTFPDMSNIDPLVAGANLAFLNDGTISRRSNVDIVNNNSNAILVKCDEIAANSNAILVNQQKITNNSNALLYCCNNNSNAILNNSQAILQNSNAIKDLSDMFFLVYANSNTFLFITKNNSNALSYWAKNNSNTLLFCSRNNSNALVFATNNNSNAIQFLTTNNSNAILENQMRIAHNSNAILFLTKNNSNASAFCCRNNSNALLDCCENNSNTLLYLVRTHSNGTGFAIKNNSNTLIDCCENNSNTLIELARNNSNALLFGLRNNSNALLDCCENNSNALLYCCNNNSNAIVWLDVQLQTIDHGPLDIIITETSHTLLFNVCLSNEHVMVFSQDAVLDGHGHKIKLASKGQGLIQICDGAHVTFKDVVIECYRDDAVLFGTNTDLIFGDCTKLEICEMQPLERTWKFEGETLIRGFDNILMIEPFGAIHVGPNSHLTIHHTDLTGLKANNMRCSGADSSITLKDTNLKLSHDYSFTSGSLEFMQTVCITGTNLFTYATDVTSTVTACSTLKIDCSNFKYAPAVANRDLLYFWDETSRLHLSGSDLCSSTTGLRLTRGKLIIDHTNTLSNDGAVSLSEAIAFGNGDAAEDLHIEVLPGASIELVAGILDYQNVDA